MKKFLISAILAASLGSVHATIFEFTVSFSDAGEPLPSPGTGSGTVAYDNIAHTLAINCTFSGLLSNTTASHIHAPTAVAGTGSAGVATTTPSFIGFPLGVTSGSYSNFMDLTSSTSWNPSFITANGGSTATAEVALANAMNAGKAYWNIHSQYSPGGEIRGFLTPVPEPTTVALVGVAAAAIAVYSRRRKRADRS